MWDKIKDQLPTIILTLVLISGVAFWLHTRSVKQLETAQREELATLRAQSNAELRAANEQTQAQIEAVNQLLKDTIAQRSSDLFLNDKELAAANAQRVDELAGAIAIKMQPFTEMPQSSEEASRQENAQIDRVSDRLAQRIEPLLANLSSDTVRARATLQKISAEFNDQLSVVLTSELAKNHALSEELKESQAVARDSMILAQEMSALYVSSFDDSGILTRILKLPANVIKDASKGSIVNSAERADIEEDLALRMAALQKRLNEFEYAPLPDTAESATP